LHLVSIGRFPESCLTEDDKHARHLEKIEVPLDHLQASDRFTLRSNLRNLQSQSQPKALPVRERDAALLAEVEHMSADDLKKRLFSDRDFAARYNAALS
jgi:hypothetical protein